MIKKADSLNSRGTYAIMTPKQLFQVYLEDCQELALQVIDKKKSNSPLGSAQVSLLPLLKEFTTRFSSETYFASSAVYPITFPTTASSVQTHIIDQVIGELHLSLNISFLKRRIQMADSRELDAADRDESVHLQASVKHIELTDKSLAPFRLDHIYARFSVSAGVFGHRSAYNSSAFQSVEQLLYSERSWHLNQPVLLALPATAESLAEYLSQGKMGIWLSADAADIASGAQTDFGYCSASLSKLLARGVDAVSFVVDISFCEKGKVQKK